MTEIIPNLFVIGVAKAGTSSLHDYLGQHPEIVMSAIKEPHFFSSAHVEENPPHTAKITDWKTYLDLFKVDKSEISYYGESSPSYAYDISSAERIGQVSPDAHIIFLLRDPIARAFSHYHMDFYAGREGETDFYKALITDQSRRKKGWGISRLYLELGLYSHTLLRFQKVFGPDNVTVAYFEEFVKRPAQVMKQIFDILDLSPYQIEPKKINQTPKDGKVLRRIKNIFPTGILPDRVKRFARDLSGGRETPCKRSIEYLWDHYKHDQDQLAATLGSTFYLDHLNSIYNLQL